MKNLSLLLVASLAAVPWLGRAASTAQVHAYCLSLKIPRGTTFTGYNMDLTTAASGVNNELVPISGSTYFAFVIINDVAEGTMSVTVPLNVDTNSNGIPDLFDIPQAIDVTTTGSYNIPGFSSGTVSARWVRYVDQAVGGAHFTLNSTSPKLTFSHFCEILDYNGTLSYTPGTNVVGSVNFTNYNDMSYTFAGPVQFQKVSTNRFNMLTLQDSYWTNQWDQTLEVWEHVFTRDLARPTNYNGTLEFLDGDLTTTDIDFDIWQMTITDTADTDGDGIPNFSDELGGALPRRPSLALTRTSTNLLLRISGDVGHVHQVQQASTINSVSWPTITSVTLTNDPQTVALPLPTGSPRFWRVAAQ